MVQVSPSRDIIGRFFVLEGPLLLGPIEQPKIAEASVTRINRNPITNARTIAELVTKNRDSGQKQRADDDFPFHKRELSGGMLPRKCDPLGLKQARMQTGCAPCLGRMDFAAEIPSFCS